MTRRTLSRAVVALLGSAAVVVVSSPAPARADEATRADALFAEGNALAATGAYAEACPKLAESQQLEPAVGTQFNLADCYEHLGRTATAYALFVDVGRIARAAGKFERERLAKARATALESRLARLQLIVKATAPGLTITIDGTLVPGDAWSQAMPIDPGEHQVVATAPARVSWAGATNTLEAQTSELVIPALVDPRPRAPDPKPTSPPTNTTSTSTQKTLAVAAASVGVAGAAVGAIAGILSISARNRAEQACAEATYHFRCPTVEGTDDWNAATTTGTISTWAFAVGGAALAGAAVLWFTAPSRTARAGMSASGLRIEGSF